MYLAQAAFPIYLLHRLVPEVLLPMAGLNLSPAATDILAILGGVALGLLAAQLQRQFGRISLRALISGQFSTQPLAIRQSPALSDK